jgi:predicted MFS family arabinose efflux permease
MSSPRFSPSVERSILLLVGAVQFVNILDFMMVMPLGPDFAPALGITISELGWIGGSYTAAAAVAGIVSSLFIDRLDRKKALLVSLAGLSIATALGGFAWSLPSLLAARVCAGMFGGPATSLAWSIVADVVEPARRGQAMGKVMGAFSIASIIGVPFGLEMARLNDWRTPFFVTAMMGIIVMVWVYKKMPSLTLHLEKQQPAISFGHLFALLRQPLNAIAYIYIMIAMMASFMIIPNISAYVQYNLHYPRSGIGWLYCIGGVVSFFTMRITGRMIDRFSATATSIVSTVTYIIVLWITFISSYHLSAVPFFILLMFALGMRNVSSTTLATKIPTPSERAGFMSLFSCLQGIGMASGAFLSTNLLLENADKSLIGMDKLAMIAACLSVFVPLLIGWVERRLVKPQ